MVLDYGQRCVAKQMQLHVAAFVGEAAANNTQTYICNSIRSRTVAAIECNCMRAAAGRAVAQRLFKFNSTEIELNLIRLWRTVFQSERGPFWFH